jgi:hypothetical protein
MVVAYAVFTVCALLPSTIFGDDSWNSMGATRISKRIDPRLDSTQPSADAVDFTLEKTAPPSAPCYFTQLSRHNPGRPIGDFYDVRDKLPNQSLSNFHIAARPENKDLLIPESAADFNTADVFIKTFTESVTNQIGGPEIARKTLEHEALMTNIVNVAHPNIALPAYYDKRVGTSGVIVTPYHQDAKNLRELSESDITTDQRVDLAVNMANAVAKLEEVQVPGAPQQGMFHGDIKPANFIQLADGSIRIIDFGGSLGYGESRVIGTTLGSPLFMSPAAWRGDKPTFQDDLHALRVSLWFMMTGEEMPKEAQRLSTHFYTPEIPRTGVPMTIPKYGPDFSEKANKYLAVAAWTHVSEIKSLKDYADLLNKAKEFSDKDDWMGFLKFYTTEHLEKMSDEVAAQTILESRNLVGAYRRGQLPLSPEKNAAIRSFLELSRDDTPGSPPIENFPVPPHQDPERVVKALTPPPKLSLYQRYIAPVLRGLGRRP